MPTLGQPQADTMLNRAVHTQLVNLERIREINSRIRDIIDRLHITPPGAEAIKAADTGGGGVLRDHLSALEVEERKITETLDSLAELESLL